jgi:hypothetical protein
MNIILEKGFLHSKIIKQKQDLKKEKFLSLFLLFNSTSNSDHSDKKNENNKHRRSSIIPRLSEAFNKILPKTNSSVSESSIPDLLDNQNHKSLFKHHGNNSHSVCFHFILFYQFSFFYIQILNDQNQQINSRLNHRKNSNQKDNISNQSPTTNTNYSIQLNK